jgi:hypothetical protein
MAVWSTESSAKAAKGLHRNAARVGKYYVARASGQSATKNLYSDIESRMADFTDDDTSLKVDSVQVPKSNIAHSDNESPFLNSRPVKWTC